LRGCLGGAGVGDILHVGVPAQFVVVLEARAGVAGLARLACPVAPLGERVLVVGVGPRGHIVKLPLAVFVAKDIADTRVEPRVKLVFHLGLGGRVLFRVNVVIDVKTHHLVVLGQKGSWVMHNEIGVHERIIVRRRQCIVCRRTVKSLLLLLPQIIGNSEGHKRHIQILCRAVKEPEQRREIYGAAHHGIEFARVGQTLPREKPRQIHRIV
jgi:hypothetical protein